MYQTGMHGRNASFCYKSIIYEKFLKGSRYYHAYIVCDRPNRMACSQERLHYMISFFLGSEKVRTKKICYEPKILLLNI